MKHLLTKLIIINAMLVSLMIIGIVNAERLDAIWVSMFSSDEISVEIPVEEEVVRTVVPDVMIAEVKNEDSKIIKVVQLIKSFFKNILIASVSPEYSRAKNIGN
jgi:hypothetical protein